MKVDPVDLERAAAAICAQRDDGREPAHPHKPTCSYSRLLAKTALDAAGAAGSTRGESDG